MGLEESQRGQSVQPRPAIVNTCTGLMRADVRVAEESTAALSDFGPFVATTPVQLAALLEVRPCAAVTQLSVTQLSAIRNSPAPVGRPHQHLHL